MKKGKEAVLNINGEEHAVISYFNMDRVALREKNKKCLRLPSSIGFRSVVEPDLLS